LGAAGCPVETGSEPNSVAIFGDLMAVAVANAVRTSNGHAVFFELNGTSSPSFVAVHEVGALPDMITFTRDGAYALTADEGEPSSYNQSNSIDPPGSVSIIKIAELGTPTAVRKVGFERFDNPGQREKLESDGVRIFGPNASVSQDLEPEYIATEGNKAFVTLQENNALAIINIHGASVEKIVGLGLKDHSLLGNKLDPRDNNNVIEIANWPVHGMYQPDAVSTFSDKGHTFLIMANEGDAREYLGFVEAVRFGSGAYPLDAAFPIAKTNAGLARLNVSLGSGDLDGDGDIDRVDVFGARSISIRDHQGRLVWDSGELLERLAQTLHGTRALFNTTNNANDFDNRSDDKGVEPESVVIGQVNGRLLAFVGLERDSGIVVLDLSVPEAPSFVTYATNRKFPVAPNVVFDCLPEDEEDNDENFNVCGDLGPEGLTFVPAGQSPSGKALLIVSNEVSSTTTIWQVE